MFLNITILDTPLFSDWSELIILLLALISLLMVWRAWSNTRRLNKRFVKSQLDMIIATLYRFAYNFEYVASENARRMTAREEGRVALSRFQLLDLETSVSSIASVAKGMVVQERTRLLEAMVTLQGEMDRAGYSEDGKRIRAILEDSLRGK
jgi:hypothetical protein